MKKGIGFSILMDAKEDSAGRKRAPRGKPKRRSKYSVRKFKIT